jgi:hypothetical protein
MTIQVGARASTDMEAAAGEGTPPNGAPAEAEADITDEKSERHEATLSVDSKDRGHTPTDNADNNPHANAV